MMMQLPIRIPEEQEESCVSNTVKNEQISVSENDSCVPDLHMKFIVQKIVELLKTQGISCCECPHTQYILSPLSACKNILNQYTLSIICPYGNAAYQFELSIVPQDILAYIPSSEVIIKSLRGGE